MLMWETIWPKIDTNDVVIHFIWHRVECVLWYLCIRLLFRFFFLLVRFSQCKDDWRINENKQKWIDVCLCVVDFFVLQCCFICANDMYLCIYLIVTYCNLTNSDRKFGFWFCAFYVNVPGSVQVTTHDSDFGLYKICTSANYHLIVVNVCMCECERVYMSIRLKSLCMSDK